MHGTVSSHFIITENVDYFIWPCAGNKSPLQQSKKVAFAAKKTPSSKTKVFKPVKVM